jgi:hypothetical protein
LQPFSIGHVNGHEFFIASKEIQNGSFANRESSLVQVVMDFCQALMPEVSQDPNQRNHVQSVFPVW